MNEISPHVLKHQRRRMRMEKGLGRREGCTPALTSPCFMRNQTPPPIATAAAAAARACGGGIGGTGTPSTSSRAHRPRGDSIAARAGATTAARSQAAKVCHVIAETAPTLTKVLCTTWAPEAMTPPEKISRSIFGTCGRAHRRRREDSGARARLLERAGVGGWSAVKSSPYE